MATDLKKQISGVSKYKKPTTGSMAKKSTPRSGTSSIKKSSGGTSSLKKKAIRRTSAVTSTVDRKGRKTYLN